MARAGVALEATVKAVARAALMVVAGRAQAAS